MIKEKKPITYLEAAKLSKKTEKSEKLKKFVKDFIKNDEKKENELKEKLLSLKIYKLKEEDIISLINFLPETSQEVIKVLPEVSLNEEEINKILNVLRGN
ncbi:MAG: hypothetical protein QW103_01615 [Candidatus Pacearchaeota archaeon]